MASEALEAEGHLLQALGQELIRIAGAERPGVFFYAEPNEEAVQSSLLAGDGDGMASMRTSPDLAALTLVLWKARRDAVGEAAAWIALTYMIVGQDFRADFITADRLDAGDSVGARGAAAFKRLTRS